MSTPPPRSTPRSSRSGRATAGCSAPTASAATSPRTRSPSILADRAHRAGRRRPPGQGEPRPRRARQRHGRHRRHRRQRRHVRAPPRRSSARPPRPLSFESDTARRPIRLPTLLLHPLKATQPEDQPLRAGARGLPRRAHRGGPPPRAPPPHRLARRGRRRRRRHRRRRWSLAYQWTQSHYFVGATTAQVAIFQGVQQNIGPIALSSVYQTTTIDVDRPAARTSAKRSRRRSTPTTCATPSTSSNRLDELAGGRMTTAVDVGRRSTPAPDRRSPERSGSGCARPPGAATSSWCCCSFALGHRRRRDRARAARRPRPRRQHGAAARAPCSPLLAHRHARRPAGRRPGRRPVRPADRHPAQRHRHRRDLPHRHRRRADTAGTPPASARSPGRRSRSPSRWRVLLVIRNHRVLQRYRYVAMFTAFVLLRAARAPRHRRSPRFGARLWIQIGPLSFQPGELAKIALAVFFAGYLVHGARLALDGRAPVPRDARSRERATSARSSSSGCWRWRVLVFQRDLGTVAALLRPVPGDDLRRHRPRSAGSCSASACSSAARIVGQPDPRLRRRSRFDAWLDSFNPDDLRRSRAAATSWCRACSASPTAASSAPGSARAVPTSRRSPRATTSSPASAKSSA